MELHSSVDCILTILQQGEILYCVDFEIEALQLRTDEIGPRPFSCRSQLAIIRMNKTRIIIVFL